METFGPQLYQSMFGDGPDLSTVDPATRAPGPSKGQMIAAILADALAGAAGGAPHAGQMLAQQRRDDQGRIDWGLKRRAGLEDYEAKQKIEQRYRAPPAMVQNVETWMQMSPEQRAAYQAMQDAQSGTVTVTLPNGQFYSGPRSGLAAAIGGAPQRPVGPLTPIDGGPTPPASGGFPRPY